MRKIIREGMESLGIPEGHLRFFSKTGEDSVSYYGGDSVENFKRRRSLPPLSTLDGGSKLFFERILTVKKIRELIFITKASAKSR